MELRNLLVVHFRNAMDLLDLSGAYRETGRAIHLAPAARALDAVRSKLMRNPKHAYTHVDCHLTGGE
jgi:hypothetical protein